MNSSRIMRILSRLCMDLVAMSILRIAQKLLKWLSKSKNHWCRFKKSPGSLTKENNSSEKISQNIIKYEGVRGVKSM